MFFDVHTVADFCYVVVTIRHCSYGLASFNRCVSSTAHFSVGSSSASDWDMYLNCASSACLSHHRFNFEHGNRK